MASPKSETAFSSVDLLLFEDKIGIDLFSFWVCLTSSDFSKKSVYRRIAKRPI